MTQRSCTFITKRLAGGHVDAPDTVEHLRGCETCRTIVAEAVKLEELLSAKEEVKAADAIAISDTAERAVRLVRQSRTCRIAGQIASLLVALILSTGLVFWAILGGFFLGHSGGPSARPELLERSMSATFVVTLVLGVVTGLACGRLRRPRVILQRRIVALVPVGFLLLLIGEYGLTAWLARHQPDYFGAAVVLTTLTAVTLGFLAGRTGLPYKRLRKGRQISGVCLGIAETYGYSPWTVRLVFVLLVLMKLSGLLLYLLLDLLMEVHPDDRQHLLRFRFRRWLDGMKSRLRARSA
ncbi:MAG TPA: PspC domain-containing protein [Thermoanaerobaculia bacterium]